MTIALVLLGVVSFVLVGCVVGNTVGWFVSRKDIATLSGRTSAPWNWRVPFGWARYHRWLTSL